MNRILYTLTILVGMASSSFAQQPTDNWCGYKGKSPWLTKYQQRMAHQNHPENDNDTTVLYVPVTFHITGNDAGNGYFSLDQAIRALCEMNDRFSDAYISFYLEPGDPVRYLNNTGWHVHGWDGGADMIQANNIPDRLNLYIVQDPAGNCGYSWYDAIVMGKNCSGAGNITWSHEAGHHFSLPHPFYGWEGFTWNYNEPAPEIVNDRQVEKMDGTNCYDSGDGFCDTEPDYLNYRWSCNDSGRSVQQQKDPNGVPFRSDATLMMGYASDVCSSRFTKEQIEAMRANLQDEHQSYLQVSEPPAGIDDNAFVQPISPIDSAIVHYKNITLKWSAIPNATFYVVEIGLNTDFAPRLYYKTIYNDTTVTITTGILNNRLLPWKVRAYSEWDLCQPNDSIQLGYLTTKNLSSVNDLESSLEIGLTPSLVSQGLPATLSISSDTKMDVLMSITDAAGRICYSENQTIFFGDNTIEVPTSGLSSGVYVVSLRNAKGILVRRLTVCN